MTLPSENASDRPIADVMAIAHRIFIDGGIKRGGIDIILDDLRSRGLTIAMVDLQLAGRLGFARAEGLSRTSSCSVRLLRPDGEETLGEETFPRVPEIVRWGLEVLLLPRILGRCLPAPWPQLAIAADPLCCLAAEHLQRRGRIDRYHFHCTDYSDSRFGIPGLDMLYRRLFAHAIKRASSVDVVSRPMYDVAAKILGESKPARLLWLPNAPPIAEYPCLPIEQRFRHRLVCSMVGVEPTYRVLDLIEIVGNLRRDFPDVQILILGKPDLNPSYSALVRTRISELGLDTAVLWAGFLPRDEARRRVAECSAGIALYDSTPGHIPYIDSLKMREYAASGLPVIANAACATAWEAAEHGAGFVVKHPADATATIRKLWTDHNLYATTALAARRWAEERDSQHTMPQLLQLLGVSGRTSEMPRHS